MTPPVLVHTVQEYAAAVGPHEGEGHETYRADDIPRRLLGRGCRTHGVEVQIQIAEFKATGDLEAFQSALEAFEKPKGGPEKA